MPFLIRRYEGSLVGKIASIPLLLILLGGLAAQAHTRASSPIDLMTPEQRHSIGIGQMSEAQKAALNGFIKDIIRKAYSLGLSKCATRAHGVPLPHAPNAYIPGGGHWIEENADGKIITLEDGSLWEIDPLDQIDTALWLPVTDIVVMQAPQAVGDYTYILLDKDDAETANAKYLGRE